MTTFPALRLIDGPAAPLSRSEKVKRMAEVLVKYDAWRNEGSAARTLRNQGYGAFDVLTLIDDARQVAMQSVVAVEMSRP